MKTLNIFFFVLTLLVFPSTLIAGPKTVSIDDVTIVEGNSGTSILTFTVTATDNPKGGETVSYTTIDGSATTADNDYDSQTGTLTFTKNDKTETISITINGDTNAESDETFNVILSLPSPGDSITGIGDGTGTGTILDDEPRSYTVTADSITVSEAVGNASLNLRVDPAITNDDTITVTYTTVDQTASAPSDYTSSIATITIDSSYTSGGTTNYNASFTIIDDTATESQEYFDVELSNASVSTSVGSTVSLGIDPGSVTINDDDSATATLSINDPSVNEGDSGTSTMFFTISVSQIQASDISINYATSGDTATAGLDFTDTSGIALLPAGTQNILVSVPIIGDLEAGEGDETLEMVISTSSSLVTVIDAIGVGTIIDNDTGLSVSINDAAIAETDADRIVNIDVIFSQALTADMNLSYFSTDITALSPDDYNGSVTPTTVTIPTGSTSHTLNYTIIGDNLSESNEDFNVTIAVEATTESYVLARPTGTVTIFDDDQNIGCSSYIGLMTINEYQNNPNYKDDTHPLANNAGKVPGNYVEIKYLDFLVKQYVNNLWSLAVYTTAGEHQLYWDEVDDACVDPRYEIFEMDNNVMGAQGYVVLRDHNNNEVDVLNIDDSDHYAQQCADFIYDTDFESSAQNKDIFREPDGTGDWVDNGSGANSGGSRCINRDGPGGLLFTIFDAIDAGETPVTPIASYTSVPIITKIANSPINLNILSLEPASGQLIASSLAVRTYLADGLTGDILPGVNPAVNVNFDNNNTVPNTTYAYARAYDNVRVRFEYCGNDEGAYENWTECWLSDDIISITNRRVGFSRDNFAIRPDHFDSNITDITSIDQIIAEDPTMIQFIAEDGAGTPTVDYNQTENTSFRIDLNVSDPANCAIANLTLTPTVSFVHGEHNDSFTVNDIGDINMTIQEIPGSEFALIDAWHNDDSSRYITPFQHNFTVIIDGLNITNTFLDHHVSVDQNFTYLSDFDKGVESKTMSSEYNLTIAAVKADGNLAQNYTNLCYANDINISLGYSIVAADGTAYNMGGALTQLHYYERDFDTGTAYTAVNIGTGISRLFTSAIFDGNATAEINLNFNFDRNYFTAIDPFLLRLDDVNVTDINDSILSTGNINQSATYLSAKSRPSLFFYDDVSEASQLTPISIMVYCNLGTTECANYGLTNRAGEFEWYLSSFHNTTSTFDDGNLTLEVDPSTAGTVNPVDPAIVPITVNGTNNAVSVTNTSATLPNTVHILFGPDTNNWLIYNPYADSIPTLFYRVRFIDVAGWAGHGDTGHVVDTNVSNIKNRRLGW